MKGWSMRIFFPLWASLFTCREVGKWRKCRSILGPNPENIRIVPKNGSGTKIWDVGCDRMVFAINSGLFLIRFNSIYNKWSLNPYQKTINPWIPYWFPYSTLGGWLGSGDSSQELLEVSDTSRPTAGFTGADFEGGPAEIWLSTLIGDGSAKHIYRVE